MASATVRLFGRKSKQRGQRRFNSGWNAFWNLVLERWRPGGSRPFAVKTRGSAKPQCTSSRTRPILRPANPWVGQVSPSGKGEGCAEPYRAVELCRRKSHRVAVVLLRSSTDPDAGEEAVRRFSSAARRAMGLGPVELKKPFQLEWLFQFVGISRVVAPVGTMSRARRQLRAPV